MRSLHWVVGDIDEAFKTVEAVPQPVTHIGVRNYAFQAGMLYWAFGQLERAKTLFEGLSEQGHHGASTEFALALGDRQSLRAYMSDALAAGHLRSFLFFQVRAGLPLDPADVEARPAGRLSERQRAERRLAETQLAEGELAFSRGDWQQAIQLFEPGLEWARSSGDGQLGTTSYLASESLATAWLEVGEEAEAVRVLESVSVVRPVYGSQLWGGYGWFRVRARFAREYRKLGLVSEAVAIEDDVLHMLKYADADHPVLLQINEARSATSGEAAAQ